MSTVRRSSKLAATRGRPAGAANARILRFTIGVAAADLDRAEVARDLIMAKLEELGLTSMGVENHFDVFLFWAEDAQPDFRTTVASAEIYEEGGQS